VPNANPASSVQKDKVLAHDGDPARLASRGIREEDVELALRHGELIIARPPSTLTTTSPILVQERASCLLLASAYPSVGRISLVESKERKLERAARPGCRPSAMARPRFVASLA
jgi:hypothetical protein